MTIIVNLKKLIFWQGKLKQKYNENEIQFWIKKESLFYHNKKKWMGYQLEYLSLFC